MFVKLNRDKTLIKVLDTKALFDPFEANVQGQQQSGQAEQPPSSFEKSHLIFPSGESLPQCWLDPNYQNQ